MARIFLSHSSGNNAEAIALRDWLVGQGWDDLFLDLDPERGLKAGERWQAALKQAAERCELVIFLVSPEWRASEWCVAEFLLAKNLNKRILGVIVDPIPLEKLPVEMTGEWQLVDLTAGKRDHKVTVAPPPGDKKVSVAFSKNGLERLRIGLMEAGLDARYFAWPPEDDPERAPYRGLEPLQAEDAGIFFGRDGPTILGLDLLRGLREAAPPRLLVILGASGAGKSSFLRAGLLPRLARESQHFLPLPVIRPERAVINGETGLIVSLAQAMKAAGLSRTRADIRKAVEAGPDSIASLLNELVATKTPASKANGTKAPKPPTLVLAVDQAEELFHAEGAEEAHAFLDLMRALMANDAPALIVIATIRSDSYEYLQTAKSLQGLHQRTLSLPPMPKGAYAEVIKGPARRLEGTKRALHIEEPLVDALLADIEEGGAKDALPLLAFTLARLYREHGGDGDLKLSEYEELGRVKGSIEAAVERALKAADSDPKIPSDRQARLALLRRGLIPWLAGIDPDTGSPRRRVARRSEIPEESAPLIDLLVEQRLLATDIAKDSGEVTIEPVHEALLRQWGLLQGWLEEDAGLLSVLEGVKRAARDWTANAKDDGWLAHGSGRLEDAEGLKQREDLAASLDATDLAYLDACRAADTARRNRELEEAKKLAEANRKIAVRTRIGFIAASVLALLAVGLAALGFLAWREANRRTQEALEAERAQMRTAELAERNFNMANSSILEFTRGLGDTDDIPIKSLKQVLERVRLKVEELIAAAPDDEQLMRIQMAMCTEFAKTYIKAGDTATAAEYTRMSEEVERRLTGTAPTVKTRTDIESYQVARLITTGKVQLNKGDIASALANYERALSIASGLVASDPKNVAAMRDILLSSNGIGDAKVNSGDLAAALGAYEQSLSVARQLVALDPSNARALGDVSETLNSIADTKSTMAMPAAAAAAYEESLAIARHLAAEDPSNTRWQANLALNLARLGDTKLRIGDYASATDSYEQSLAIRRSLMVKDPGNAQWARDVSQSLERIGNARLDAGDRIAALAVFEESLAIARKLAMMDEASTSAQVDLVVALYKVAKSAEGKRRSSAIDEGLLLLRQLEGDGRLTEVQKGWEDTFLALRNEP